MGVSTPAVIVSPCAKSCYAIKDDWQSVPAPECINVDYIGFLGTIIGIIYGGTVRGLVLFLLN